MVKMIRATGADVEPVASVNRQPDRRAIVAGPLDTMATPGRQQQPIACGQLDERLTPLDPQTGCPTHDQHPLVPVLIIPLALGGDLTV